MSRDPDAVRVKICGVRTQAAIDAAAASGAAYVGFVFYPRSPRCVTLTDAAALAAATPPGLCKVGLFVDPDDVVLDAALAAVPLDMIQLHGAETPERVAAVRRATGLPVMKAAALGEEADLSALDAMEGIADQILCDAKPRSAGELPGGNGIAFDWRLISDRPWRGPWMLAGGLTVETVGRAIALTGARQVDVSSGVESAPGVKDVEKIKAFVEAAGRVA